ncbi:MAG: copper amine oxidase N-terminal domain-containing protein [Oscillibacter sp.]|nr:copper amine oxidase N-terminal domain-containing protein [Oscillibacter sp.]
MRKRILALGLALAMCLGLSVTALASGAPDVEGYEAIDVKISDCTDIYLSENIVLSSSDRFAKPSGYAKITPDTQIRVSNTGTDSSAYIFVELDSYYYYLEYQTVAGQRTYYDMDATTRLCRSEGGDDELFAPASNGLYWNFEWPETDSVKLYPGSSAAFTLPEPEPGEDVIYVLWCYIYYPEYNQSFYRNYFISYSDLPGVLVADAVPTASTVLVNGEKVSFDAYNIGGNNYFKLRDLAYVLSGTGKQFEVGWDGATNSISLTSGKPYTAVGGEMAAGTGTTQIALASNAKILLDGREISLTAYNINSNNYFKLRDIGQTFDFGVGWDGATRTITIDTTQGYTAG